MYAAIEQKLKVCCWLLLSTDLAGRPQLASYLYIAQHILDGGHCEEMIDTEHVR